MRPNGRKVQGIPWKMHNYDLDSRDSFPCNWDQQLELNFWPIYSSFSKYVDYWVSLLAIAEGNKDLNAVATAWTVKLKFTMRCNVRKTERILTVKKTSENDYRCYGVHCAYKTRQGKTKQNKRYHVNIMYSNWPDATQIT